MTPEPRSESGQPPEIEALKPALLERFGSDFLALVENMGLQNAAHLRELLDAAPDEQDELVLAWMRAAAAMEAEWRAQSRRLPGASQITLSRHMAIRLPSPRAALVAQQAAESATPAEVVEPPAPTPRERESAQRRIRLELAIAEARAALQRIDAVDRLVDADRQAIVAELEDIMALISRRIRIGG
jgi:hypothetical protein